jgi:hypothetical protein
VEKVSPNLDMPSVGKEVADSTIYSNAHLTFQFCTF